MGRYIKDFDVIAYAFVLGHFSDWFLTAEEGLLNFHFFNALKKNKKRHTQACKERFVWAASLGKFNHINDVMI